MKTQTGFKALISSLPVLWLAQGVALAADAHEKHEKSAAGLPQFDPSTFPSQIFWLFVTFAILYLFFSRKTLPEISSTIENRRSQIENDLITAEQLRAEAEAAQRTYEEGLENARTEATKALSDVQEKMKAKAEKQAEQFRQKTEKESLALEKNLEKAKKAAMDDMNTIAAEVASAAAEKIVGINPDIEQAKTVVKAINGGSTAKAA